MSLGTVLEPGGDRDAPWIVDTSERAPVYLFTGKNGSRMRLSADAHRLLQLRGAGITAEQIAEALRRKGGTVTAEEVETRYRDLLQRIETIEARHGDNPRGFWLRIRLLPEAWVARLVKPLRAAFRPAVAPFLLAVIVAGVAGIATLRPGLHGGATAFWLGYGLFLVSMVLHELGHASACSYFGVRPSDIGATVYLIYPALYSDVSSAWELQRRQRVVVDLGGLYFQFLTGALFWGVYLWTHRPSFAMAFLMILGSAVFSLNPIFKFDGYWVIADALGVTNLGSQPLRVVGHYLRRLRGRPSPPLPWSAGTTAVLTVYSALSFLVWGWFFWPIGPRIWLLIRVLPRQVAAFAAGSPDVKLQALLMSAFMAAMTLFISVRMVRSLVVAPLRKAIHKAVQQWQQRRRDAAPGLDAGREVS